MLARVLSATIVAFITLAPRQPPAVNAAGTRVAFPNEPRGHAPVTHRDFAGRHEAPGWMEGPSHGIDYVSDSTAGGSPPSVARVRFPAGMRGGIAPAHAEYRFPPDARFRQIYVSYWFKVSRAWYGHPVVSKIGYAWIDNSPMFYIGLIGKGTAPWRVQARLQGLAGAPVQGTNLAMSPRAGMVARNTWHQLEVVLVANSEGAADGQVRWWLDGSLVGAADDIRWVGQGSPAWDGVSWRPIWGGSGGTVPTDQYMYLDDLYVSGLVN